MPARSLTLLLLVYACLGAAASAQPDVLLTNVNVLPMTSERVLPNRDVLIREGRFAAIEPTGTLTVAVDVERRDGSGKYLMPGLMDLHVHFKGGEEIQPDMLYLYLANGVTTVLSMGGSSIVLDLRSRVAEGDLLGPRIFTTSPIIGNISAYPKTAEKAHEIVAKYAARGYDFLKVYNQIPEAGYWGIIEAAKEHEIPVVGHAVRAVGIEGAIKAGQHIVHMEEFLYGYFEDDLDEARIRPLAEELKSAGISVVATLITYHNIVRQVQDIDAMLASPGVEYLPWRVAKYFQPDLNEYVKQFDERALEETLEPSMAFQQALTRIFHEVGVPVLAGTDSVMAIVVPGFSLHDELEELVLAGLSPYEALRSASVLPAQFLGQPDLGTIEAGKVADAILVEADPLEDITATRQIAAVVTRGRWLPRGELDARLEVLEEKASASKTAD
jgi:imidazolonepropionase-like amidohydrolase